MSKVFLIQRDGCQGPLFLAPRLDKIPCISSHASAQTRCARVPLADGNAAGFWGKIPKPSLSGLIKQGESS
jgi:hypothetical protein